MSPRGGKRKGAGRKPRLKNARVRTLKLDEELDTWVEASAGELGISAFIRQKLREAKAREENE